MLLYGANREGRGWVAVRATCGPLLQLQESRPPSKSREPVADEKAVWRFQPGQRLDQAARVDGNAGGLRVNRIGRINGDGAHGDTGFRFQDSFATLPDN